MVKSWLKTASGLKVQQLDIQQQALKLTANRFYAKQLAKLITLQGREILQSTVDLVQNNLNLEVIYGDTGSIMIYSGLDDIAKAKAIAGKVIQEVSEYASWSGCFYLRMIQAALATVGAPENLVDIITGFAETGEALVSSVDKVIFVGSPGVGRTIMRNAAETLTPVTLELGGKDAFIVCEDVDVPHVAQITVRAALQSSGQNCAGAEKFYVHRDIYSSFVAEVVKIIKSITAIGMGARAM